MNMILVDFILVTSTCFFNISWDEEMLLKILWEIYQKCLRLLDVLEVLGIN